MISVGLWERTQDPSCEGNSTILGKRRLIGISGSNQMKGHYPRTAPRRSISALKQVATPTG